MLDEQLNSGRYRLRPHELRGYNGMLLPLLLPGQKKIVPRELYDLITPAILPLLNPCYPAPAKPLLSCPLLSCRLISQPLLSCRRITQPPVDSFLNPCYPVPCYPVDSLLNSYYSADSSRHFYRLFSTFLPTLLDIFLRPHYQPTTPCPQPANN